MQIAAGALRHNLLEAFNKSKSLVPIFESSIIQTRTKLHLNQLSRLAAEALCEIERNAVADRTLPTGVRSEFMRIEEEGKKNISEYERKNRDTTDVLLASWLSEQDGLIQQIACLEPNALLVRVDGRGTSPYQCPHPAQP